MYNNNIYYIPSYIMRRNIYICIYTYMYIYVCKLLKLIFRHLYITIHVVSYNENLFKHHIIGISVIKDKIYIMAHFSRPHLILYNYTA